MKAYHLNALIDSYLVISETAMRLIPRKGDVYAKEKFETQKQYVFYITFEGDIKGIFSICVMEEVLFKLVQKMTNSEKPPTTIDGSVITAATEFVSMIKSNLIKRFEEMKINFKIQRADFLLKEEIPNLEEKILTVNSKTDIGEFELNMFIEKKE